MKLILQLEMRDAHNDTEGRITVIPATPGKLKDLSAADTRTRLRQFVILMDVIEHARKLLLDQFGSGKLPETMPLVVDGALDAHLGFWAN